MAMSLYVDRIGFEERCSRIEGLVSNILQLKVGDNIDNARWQQTFSDIYKICVVPDDESSVNKLYSSLEDLLKDHVQDTHKNIASDKNLIISYNNQWITYRIAIESIKQLFVHLNNALFRANGARYHHPEPKLEVGELCRKVWQLELIEPLRERLASSLLERVEFDGKETDQVQTSNVIRSFVEVGICGRFDVYQALIERPFLKSARKYYKNELEGYRAKLDSSDFLKRVCIYQIIQNVEIVGIIAIIDEILLKCSKFMHASTIRPLLTVLHEETLKCTSFIHCSSRDKIISEIKTRKPSS